MSAENEQTMILREILKWTKFAGMNQVQSVLENTLNTPEKRLAYQLRDGKTGTREVVAERSRVGSTFKVSSLWKEWRRKGIGETLSVQGGGERFVRVFDLEDFGIGVPEISHESKTRLPAEAAHPTIPEDGEAPSK